MPIPSSQPGILTRLTETTAPSATLLIRLAVGAVFVSEGIQKFLYPAVRGSGRFESIGLPAPDILATFVGSVEIIAGLMVLVGLLTRVGALMLGIVMLTAIVTTKIPILLGNAYWGLNVRELSSYGFWSMAHASRTDFAMFLGSLFLLITGPGPYSIDQRISSRQA